jgi:alanine dehydrogenase
MKTLILNQSEVKKLLTMNDVLTVVEEGYIQQAREQVVQPAIVSIEVPEYSGELDIKSCYSKENDSVSVKTAVGYMNNRRDYNLPTLLATIIIYDAKNGYPLCIMDGGLVTGLRTGAAGGVSAKYLSRKDSKVLSVIGAGGQARMQARAISLVRPIEKIKVWSGREVELEGYKKDVEADLGISVETYTDINEAIDGADIIVTTTPSKEALFEASKVAPGTHIAAIGADMPGKQEIDSEIYRSAKAVVDNTVECVKRGETSNAIIGGIIKEEDLYGEIGEIVIGKKKGRESDDEITIFDSTGMGIQDNVVAKLIYDKALELKMGTELSLID